MLDFTSDSGHVSVPNNQDIPKDMDIFYRNERDFLPEGKDFADLTKEEMETLRSQYRFSPYRPGVYQGITGFGVMTL